MLMFAFILAAVSVWLELRIFKMVPAIGKLNERVPLFGIVFSMGLSYFIGEMFGAGGLIALLAGIMSTAMSEPYRRWKGATGDTLIKVNKIRGAVSQTTMWSKEFHETYRYALVALKWIMIILLSPIWIPVLMHRAKKEKISAYQIIKPMFTKSTSTSEKIAA